MISELNDEQILDLLMTSEFEGDLSPSEFRYLLTKWRYFYRVLHGRFERVSDDLNFEIKCKENEISDIKQQNYKILVDCADKQNIIDLLKNRKLTIRERWTGKIIEKKDEDKTM
jgi:hypothetical protein